MTGLLIVLLLFAVAYFFGKRPRPNVDSDLKARVEFLERRVADLQLAVDTLRRSRAAATAPPPRPTTPPPPPKPKPAPAPPVATPPPPSAPAFDWRPKVEAADLMGAKALAFAGGIVTLLGVVFFFVLAVNRGWIGPELRVACGGLASAIVFGAGLWLQRRFETTYSALAAVGAGVAGAYATLLASVALYDLISKPVALVVAAGIASVGVAVSLAWSEEIVAGFGLIGAMVVPATLVLQGGLQQIGTGFVAVVLGATAVVAVRERWWTMLKVAALVSAPQALAQIAGDNTSGAGVITLAIVFWLLYLAAGIAFQLRIGAALASAPASFLLGSAVFAGISATLLYDAETQGVALLVVAAAYVAVAAGLFRPRREVAALVSALGLGLGAVGLADVLSGSSLTYAWAAEAAVLAWIGSRVRDSRFQLLSLAYLALALVHAVVFEASPEHLFRPLRHPASGALALAVIAVAAAVFAFVKRNFDDPPATGILRVLDPALRRLRAQEALVSIAMYALGAVVTAYAVSLGILELFQATDIQPAFAWGQVAVTAVWSLGGLAAVLLALRKRSGITLGLGFCGLVLVVLKVLTVDPRYDISLLIVGAAVLLAGLARELAEPGAAHVTGEGAAAVVLSFALLVGGLLVLLGNDGVALVSLGALYVLLAAGVFPRRGQRDLSTLLWVLGLATVAVGEGMLLAGSWLVLAYSATAAALALVSVRLRERRLQVGSLAYLVGGATLALVVEAPPANRVMAQSDPGHGIPSLLMIVAATLALAWALAWHEGYRLQAAWTAGALAVYTASLAILEAAQRISPEGVNTDFQRGQTAVSAFWGLLALASLYLGLRQRRGLLRGGGFILFAISLGKIFLFDLPNLSSAQRALSFLAVGAVLLLGGFFYQRLSAQFDEQAA